MATCLQDIRSREHAVKLGEEIQLLCTELFRDYNAKQNWGFSVEQHGHGEDMYHTVSFSWCAVDVGFPVDVSDIRGHKEVPGYHTWIGVCIPGNRDTPDDYDFKTISETTMRSRAVHAVVCEFTSWRLNMLIEERQVCYE